jgi:hypothetical protein
MVVGRAGGTGVDEHGAEVRERREHDREEDRQDPEERARHRG